MLLGYLATWPFGYLVIYRKITRLLGNLVIWLLVT